ncbi:unnamed protein product, partial [Iphiclides podalirius]
MCLRPGVCDKDECNVTLAMSGTPANLCRSHDPSHSAERLLQNMSELCNTGLTSRHVTEQPSLLRLMEKKNNKKEQPKSTMRSSVNAAPSLGSKFAALGRPLVLRRTPAREGGAPDSLF